MTAKREPVILVAASKSSPRRAPTSVERLEVELARRAEARDLRVAGLVLAVRHAGIRRVGQAGGDGFDARQQIREPLFGGLELITQPGHFGHHG
jgi:hypothetical protein